MRFLSIAQALQLWLVVEFVTSIVCAYRHKRVGEDFSTVIKVRECLLDLYQIVLAFYRSWRYDRFSLHAIGHAAHQQIFVSLGGSSVVSCQFHLQ